MIGNTQELRELLSRELSPIGFSRKGSNWFRRTADIIQVVNLQRSPYGGQYYINLGILLRALDDSEFPEEYHCHIRLRMTEPSSEPSLERVLDLEDRSIKGDVRADVVSEAVDNHVRKFFEEMSDAVGIRRVVKSRKYRNLGVIADARRFLGIPIE